MSKGIGHRPTLTSSSMTQTPSTTGLDRETLLIEQHLTTKLRNAINWLTLGGLAAIFINHIVLDRNENMGGLYGDSK